VAYINKFYGIKTAKEIAKDLKISINRVYNLNRAVIGKMLNPKIKFNKKQEQVILSGILGDGNIKQNGRNCYYREGHAKTEINYCKFKYDILKPYITNCGFKIIDKRNDIYGFQTINTPSLLEFKNMKHTTVIEKINKFGLILYLLDDGWTKPSCWYLAVNSISIEDRKQLINKFNTEFGTEAHEIKNDVISFTKNDVIKILPFVKKYIPNDLDIYEKKISKFDRFDHLLIKERGVRNGINKL